MNKMTIKKEDVKIRKTQAKPTCVMKPKKGVYSRKKKHRLCDE